MMRIIAGKHRSRQIMVPEETDDIRPTADRVRETLFSMLTHRLGSWDDAVVLDACCGSGALGLEAISRGAGRAYFLDNSPTAIKLTKQNAEGLKEAAHCRFMLGSVIKPPKAQEACDVLLMDAPYNQELSEKGLLALTSAGWMKPASLAAIEIARAENLALPADWQLLAERETGPAKLLILQKR